MVEEQARVISVAGGDRCSAVVRVVRQSACDSCQLRAGCGTSALVKLSGKQCIDLSVANELQAEPGDMVWLAIPEHGLLTASLLMYLLPLVLMVLAAVLAKSFFAWPDGAVAMAGLIALISGFAIARTCVKTADKDPRFTPVMVRIEARHAALLASSS